MPLPLTPQRGKECHRIVAQLLLQRRCRLLKHDLGNTHLVKRAAQRMHNVQGDAVPDTVSGVVRRRLASLPRATRAAVTAAALLGVEFGLARLAVVVGVEADDIAASLDPPLGAGLVVESAPGRYRFGQGLVRDAVAGQVSGSARVRLEAAITRIDADEAGQPCPTMRLAGQNGRRVEPSVADGPSGQGVIVVCSSMSAVASISGPIWFSRPSALSCNT